LNESVVTTFVARRMRSGRANPVVVLRVPSALHAHPWEARLLRFVAVERPWRWKWAPNVARELPARAGGAPRLPLPDRVVVITSARWERLAREPWPSTRQVDQAGDLECPVPARVGLLVGAGVETASGPRLRLDLERLATVSEATVSSAATAEEALLAPEAVVAAGLEVVIVLGAPGPLDPASSAPLRAFGAAVAAGGARVVLVLPTLPPDVAAAALAFAAAGWPFSARAARRAVRRVRATVYKQLDSAAALDVCLFLADGG
jgi:hypothetical protein